MTREDSENLESNSIFLDTNHRVVSKGKNSRISTSEETEMEHQVSKLKAYAEELPSQEI
jgi:hypothetical protein